MANVAIIYFFFHKDSTKIPPFYEGLCTELKKKHSVILVNTYSSINKNFASEYISILKDVELKIANFKPDLIISFNNVISETIYQTTNCPVLIIEADTYAYFKNKNLITKYLERNYIGVARKNRFALWKDILPEMSAKDRFFEFRNGTSLYAQGLEQDINISTIGTIESLKKENKIVQFIHNNWQDKSRMMQFRSILQKAQFNLASISEEDYKFLGADYNNLFSFISYLNRTYLLDNLVELGLCTWGRLIPSYMLPNLMLSFQPESVMTIAENANIYNRSKISLNIHFAHNVMEESLSVYSWRVLDAMSTNACLVSTFCPAIQEDFKKWVEIPMFNNRHEAYDLCKKLLKEENLRKEISLKSRLAVNEGGFTFAARVLELEEKFNLKESPANERVFEALNSSKVPHLAYIKSKTIRLFNKVKNLKKQ